MAAVFVRPATLSDVKVISAMCSALWPEVSAEEHAHEVGEMLATGRSGGLPATYFIAKAEQDQPSGFVQVGLRSHADGCDAEHPVGFIEGWFALPEQRGHGVGAALIRIAEDWAHNQGCREMGSDTWLDNEPSQRAHEAIGYEVVDRCVHYRKALY